MSKNFSKNLKYLRTTRKISQQQLADKLEIEKQLKNIKQPNKKPIKEFNLKAKEIYDIMVDREVNEKIKYTAIHSLIDYVIYDKKNDTIDIYYK